MIKKSFTVSIKISVFVFLLAVTMFGSCKKEDEYSPDINIHSFDYGSFGMLYKRYHDTTVFTTSHEPLSLKVESTLPEEAPVKLEEFRLKLWINGRKSIPNTLLYGMLEEYFLDWLLSLDHEIKDTSVDFNYCPEQVTDINFYLDDDQHTCINSSVEIYPKVFQVIVTSDNELYSEFPKTMSIEEYLSLKPLLSDTYAFQFVNIPVDTPAEIRIIMEIKLGNGIMLSNTTRTIRLTN